MQLTSDMVRNVITDNEAPRSGATASGYGGRIPTRYRVELTNGRTYRVYTMQYGNSGSPYITIGGVQHFVSDNLF